MFTKKKVVGAVTKTVTDWDAVFGAVVLGFIALALLGSCAGS